MQLNSSQHKWLRALAAFGVVATMIATVSASPASAAEDDVVFEGAGLGHGVGMSQWGAYQRSLTTAYESILSHYYVGTTISSYDEVSSGHGPLHVNLRYDQTEVTLAARNTSSEMEGGGHAPVVVTRGSSSVELIANHSVTIDWSSENDCTAEFKDHTGTVTATWGSGSCDVDLSWDGDAESPSTTVEIVGCSLQDFDGGTYRPCRYGRGAEISTLDNVSPLRNSSGMDVGYDGFDLILVVDIDDYVLGISEVSYSWPTDSLKAQAVAARSYAATHLDAKNPLGQKCGCHVKDTSADQRYVGWGHIGHNNNPDGIYSQTYWVAASNSTENEILTHPEAPSNGVVETVYSASNGGASEAAHDRWPGAPKEYLSSVPDPESLLPAGNSFRSWTRTSTVANVESRVWSGTKDLASIEVTERNTSGSVKTVAFHPTDGGSATLKTVAWVVSAFGLPSWYFDVSFGGPAPPPPPATFTDIDGSVHRADIEFLADLGVAIGCDTNPDRFCPDDRMRREDLAAFMVRALDLPPTATDYFHDDNGLPYEDDINSLAEAGITKGCNPPANDEFCPDDTVTRGQTAAFIVRAWSLTDPGAGDRFDDDDSSVFEGDIDRLAEAGITKGCNPPNNTNYCPTRLLTRAEMSSFLARALREL